MVLVNGRPLFTPRIVVAEFMRQHKLDLERREQMAIGKGKRRVNKWCNPDSAKRRFWEKVNKNAESGCWEWIASCKNGYGRLGVNHKQEYAHRLSWGFHFGPIPSGTQVLHKCDNRLCVNPDHLFLGSQQDNIIDMINKGRGKIPPIYRPSGEKNGQNKLTLEQVKSIIADCKAGVLQKITANKYNISRQTVSDIYTGRRWAHVDR